MPKLNPQRQKISITRQKLKFDRNNLQSPRKDIPNYRRRRPPFTTDEILDSMPLPEIDQRDEPLKEKRLDKQFAKEQEIQKRNFRESQKKIQKTFEVTSDVDYYVCIVFLSRDQKNEFLKKAGWDRFGKKFISGLQLAKEMGIEIQKVEFKTLDKHTKTMSKVPRI